MNSLERPLKSSENYLNDRIGSSDLIKIFYRRSTDHPLTHLTSPSEI